VRYLIFFAEAAAAFMVKDVDFVMVMVDLCLFCFDFLRQSNTSLEPKTARKDF
jgi:hypothetical protein